MVFFHLAVLTYFKDVEALLMQRKKAGSKNCTEQCVPPRWNKTKILHFSIEWDITVFFLYVEKHFLDTYMAHTCVCHVIRHILCNKHNNSKLDPRISGAKQLQTSGVIQHKGATEC